jgi:hypothetical protein
MKTGTGPAITTAGDTHERCVLLMYVPITTKDPKVHRMVEADIAGMSSPSIKTVVLPLMGPR